MTASSFHDTRTCRRCTRGLTPASPAADAHFGSADLVAYRPSLVELDLAGRVIADPHDEATCRDLLAVTQSTDRAEAIIAYAVAVLVGVGK